MCFLDLEFQELVNCFKRVGISGRDLNHRAAIGLFEFVTDLRLEPCHDLTSRRCFLVNEHGNLEVAFAEHDRDVPQMTANLITAFSVLRIVRFNLYRAAISRQQEMMGCFRVIETHVFIATHVHLVDLFLCLCVE